MIANPEVHEMVSFFERFGETDVNYLRSHFDRWVATKQFATEGLPSSRLRVLDIGAHWLHNAYLYAIDGHQLICADAPDTFQMGSVRAVAAELGIKLIPTRRLERGEGFEIIEDSSIDLVLFCEIIEHLTFNPIPLWKEIYRILAPGGRIIVTTPNAFYFRNVNSHYEDLVAGRRIGIPVHDIMEQGTYGHHWKEFGLDELLDYFDRLSPDFVCDRWKMIERPEDISVPIEYFAASLPARASARAYNIYLEVRLDEKKAGIAISPPWVPA